MADGYIVDLNNYDGQIYCYGKGPSATTVSASPKVSVNGDSVLIEGMVTDESAGTKGSDLTARFPHGVPCVADGNMTAWCEYLYKQKSMPTTTGVEVKLETLDPNGNFYEIGRTTTENGMYSYAFTPEVPGLYTIFATFEGSKSYYGSNVQTAINVGEAPVATAEPTPPPPSMADLYFMPMSIGLIIAIVAVGLVIILMLRKR